MLSLRYSRISPSPRGRFLEDCWVTGLEIGFYQAARHMQESDIFSITAGTTPIPIDQGSFVYLVQYGFVCCNLEFRRKRVPFFPLNDR
jgi:hypothetical protein